MNFNQMCSIVNGEEPYTSAAPPPNYNFENGTKLSNPCADRMTADNYDLQPMSFKDMAQSLRPEYDLEPQAIQTMDIKNMNGETKPLDTSFEISLRSQISDDEFKKYTGITW